MSPNLSTWDCSSGLKQGDCVSIDARNASSTWLRLTEEKTVSNGQRLWVSAEFIKLGDSIEDLPVASPPE